MRNDRPKAIIASVVFAVLGTALVALFCVDLVARDSWSLPMIAFGVVFLIIRLLLLVTLKHDPFPAGLGVRADALSTGRPHVLGFTVGQTETHVVSFRWDQLYGWLTVTVDGVLVSKQLVTLSFRLVRVIEFTVGQKETHVIRIVKRRALVASFAQPQPIEAFVDGSLLAAQDGSATS